MLLPPFAKLPSRMQNSSVKATYITLSAKRKSLVLKRFFDITLSLLLIALLLPLMLITALVIAVADRGSPLFFQERVTQFGKTFMICKFKTMHRVAGESVTAEGDSRITPIGRFLRAHRLDELPQLFNILRGEMSFVGPRPELPEFVALYDADMLKTLLLPAGLTNEASLFFCDEARILNCRDNERVYAELVLPRKTGMNIRYVERLSLRGDMLALLQTIGKLF